MQEVNGKHLLKAEPLNAILDPQYFIRQVHECVVRVLNDRAAKEHQVASQSSFYRYGTKFHILRPIQARVHLLRKTSQCM